MNSAIEIEDAKPRRKAFIHRSQQGCRTCRIRHVKCDETPVACVKCTSTGRQCDGYDAVRLPVRRRFRNVTFLNSPKILLPDKTSDERRSFSFFQSLTVPMMNSWFDHPLWERAVLQYSQGESAICHAVIAVSVLHEESETTGEPVLPENMMNPRHQFAVLQYNRSIAYLNSRIASSNDPDLTNVVLICCLLYITFELICGKYDRAHTHLRNGVQILKDHESKNSLRESAIVRNLQPSLSSAMMHLDLQGLQWGASSLLDGWSIGDMECFGKITQNTIVIESLTQGLEVRDRLMDEVCIFRYFAKTLCKEVHPTNIAFLSSIQQRLRMRMAEFGQALARLEKARLGTRLTTAKDKRGIDLLRMHYLGMSLRLDLCLIESMDTIRANFAHRFVELLEQVELVTSGFRDERCSSSPRRPSLFMETGVIVPLFYICEESGDPELSRRAMEVLESWPHREGLWDSNVAATMIRSMGALNGNGNGFYTAIPLYT